MSGVVPDTRDAMIEFYKAHSAGWQTNAVAVGLTILQADELKAKADAAAADLSNALAVRQQSKDATQKVNNSAAELASFGAGIMSTIRGFAESTGDPNVYVLAGIPGPKPPTPLPAPATPTMISANVRGADGAVELAWAGSIAGGTGFNVYRRLGEGANALLANITGARRFTDVTIPACTLTATYSLTAVRAGLASKPSEGIVVRFAGLDGSGMQEQQAEAA